MRVISKREGEEMRGGKRVEGPERENKGLKETRRWEEGRSGKRSWGDRRGR